MKYLSSFRVFHVTTVLIILGRSDRVCQQYVLADHIFLFNGTSKNISYSHMSEDSNTSNQVVWIVETHPLCRIRVSFFAFNLSVGYELLEVGDGSEATDQNIGYTDNDTFTTLARYSGYEAPWPVTSMRSLAWIRFSSIRRGREMHHTVFSLELSSLNGSAQHTLHSTARLDTAAGCCWSPIKNVIDISENEIHVIPSPNFPENYPNNYFNTWHIVVPDGNVVRVRVEAIDIENGGDHLYIGDGVDKFSNKQARWRHWTGHKVGLVREQLNFVSTNSSIVVIFTTDFSKSKSGFNITFTAMPKLGPAVTTSSSSQDTGQKITEPERSKSTVDVIPPGYVFGETVAVTSRMHSASTNIWDSSTKHASMSGDVVKNIGLERLQQLIPYGILIILLGVALGIVLYRWYRLRQSYVALRNNCINSVQRDNDDHGSDNNYSDNLEHVYNNIDELTLDTVLDASGTSGNYDHRGNRVEGIDDTVIVDTDFDVARYHRCRIEGKSNARSDGTADDIGDFQRNGDDDDITADMVVNVLYVPSSLSDVTTDNTEKPAPS